MTASHSSTRALPATAFHAHPAHPPSSARKKLPIHGENAILSGMKASGDDPDSPRDSIQPAVVSGCTKMLDRIVDVILHPILVLVSVIGGTAGGYFALPLASDLVGRVKVFPPMAGPALMQSAAFVSFFLSITCIVRIWKRNWFAAFLAGLFIPLLVSVTCFCIFCLMLPDDMDYYRMHPARDSKHAK